MSTQQIALDSVVIDKTLQVRLSGLNSDTVEQYAAAMKKGEEFPPIVVYDTSDGLILADGFHRHTAADMAGVKTIEAQIIVGSYDDALWYSRYVANRKNGQRLSRADVERVVEYTLRDPKLAAQSNRQLGEMCGCSHVTIKRFRQL